MTDHQYTLTSQWVNADGTQNYSAVVTATPKNSLKFTADSMPQTLKVNVDGTNIKDVSVTNSSVDENGVLTITYDFEKMFIGGSLRMDHGNTYDQTSMRYGYDFTLPDGATFVGCEWYYGTAENALVNTLQPKETKYITNPDSKGANVYRSNIVFTNLGSANYENNVYARVLVKYTLNGKSYSKMGSSIDTRTVKAVAESIRDSKDASEKQKIYANGILGTISK